MTSVTCKPNSSFPLKPLTAAMLLVFSANVHTAPILDGVLDNNLSIEVSSPGTTKITQEVNRPDVIDWHEFSIGADETVEFVQPDVNAVIVNRVNGGVRSDILGDLVANGRVFLINPSGIVFGAGAEINVNGLVASTLNLRNEGSVQGPAIEFEAATDTGSILNEGNITAKDIVFLAPAITNTGNLTATGTNGSVSLITADEASVSTVGGNLDAQVLQGSNSALIEQLGNVLAEGGRIILLASTSSNGAASVINTAGVNQASEIRIEGDLVQLTGSFNADNAEGTVDIIASHVSQNPDDSLQALSVGGDLNLNADSVVLNNAGNDFTGRVDLAASGSVGITDSNSLQVSVNAGGVANVNAGDLVLNGLNSGELNVDASGAIEQTAAVVVGGATTLTANEIDLSNSANQFGSEVNINSIGNTTVHTNDDLQISGSAGTLNLTASDITQGAALSVSGATALNAEQLTLLDPQNDFAGNVELSVTGSVSLNDSNSLSVSGSAGAVDLTALNEVQLNNLNANSLGVTAAGITQTGALTVQQGTALNADSVQLADEMNNFLGTVQLNNVGDAELSDQDTLTLAGRASTLRATAATITQNEETGPLVVGNTARFNGGSVELLQAGNTFGGNVALNLDGQAQLGTAGDLLVSGRAGSVTLNADSVRQGDTESDALIVLGQTRINNSNTVDLSNDANQFGSSVILQDVGATNLKGNETLTVQGSSAETILATDASGQLVLSGLNAESLTASAASIEQTDFVNIASNSTLSANNINLTSSDSNQFGDTVTVNSGEHVAIKADGPLTVTGLAAFGDFEADTLVLNGLAASNGLVLTAGSVTQSADIDRALRVQGETRINSSGDVTLGNAVNDFEGDVVLNSSGPVRLTDSNLLTVEGQVGALELTAQTILQNSALVVDEVTSLSASTVTLTDLNNDFQGQVNLLGNARASVRDANTLNVTGTAQELQLTAGTVEVTNALNIVDNLTLTVDSATQAASGAATLIVGGDTTIQRNTPGSNAVVRLNNTNNDFNGPVSLNDQVNVELTDKNTLTVQGEAGSLFMTAAEVNQLGDLTVQDQTTLNAGTVELTNSANDFAGDVVMNSVGNVNLQDQQAIALQGSAGSLNVQAGTEINQSGAINVSGNSTLAATSINLLDAANNFDGVVDLQASDTAQLWTTGDLAIQGDVGGLNIRAAELTQLESLAVRNNATIAADSVQLDNTANDFQASLSLNVSGDTQVVDINDLLVTGNLNTASLTADTLILDKLDALGNVTFNAISTVQNGELSVGGTSTFNGDAVTLENLDNTFDGAVNLNLAAGAALVASGDLEVTGKASEINAQAGSLAVSNLTANDITVQADQLALNNFTTAGNLTLNGGNVTQQGALQVSGVTTLGASNVTLQSEGNLFQGGVVLTSAGNVNLQVQEAVALQGSAVSLNIQAGGDLNQSAALNVSGESNLSATNINLEESANNFGGTVIVNTTGQATVNANGNLSVGGNAATLTTAASNALNLDNSTLGALNATAQQITQSDVVTVSGLSTLSAEELTLLNASNDLGANVNLDVAGQASIADRNDVLIQGKAETLNTAVAGTLTAGDLEVVRGTLQASEIKLNQLKVGSEAELRADNIVQTQASQSGGTLTLAANNVELSMDGNDFSGQVVLQNVNAATIHDSNDLILGGRVNSLTVDAQGLTQLQDQAGALIVQGTTDLRATQVDLQNASNNFSGAVNLQVSNAAQLRDANNLIAQGDVGSLNVKAGQLTQADSLIVRGNSTIEAASVQLNNSANDFQGDVALNVSGSAAMTDSNALSVSGQINGAIALRAQSIAQTDALRANSSVLLQADRIDLANQGNSLNGLVRVEGAREANLRSLGTLRVQGANLGELDLQAEAVSLGDLGELQQLQVTADEVRQTAALNVQGGTNLFGSKIDLNNSGNDFGGVITVQNEGVDNSLVSVSDRNDLAMQGENLELTARIQGNFELQAANVALGDTQVDGSSQIELTGSLTQNRSVNLNNASFKAEQITLTNSGNRFNGRTQVQSGGAVALGTSGDLILDTASSTATLALDVGGDTQVEGAQVQFADSRLGGDLAVSANQVAQTGRLQVEGDAEFEAIGGAIDLQHAGNRFQGTVSASAEQTRLATVGDMQLVNLTSRGGQVSAEGRIFLLGNIEQTGGALTFTAKGVSRPLSSADIALLLPPSLDVFSSKEAVNPLTGLGRITLTSPMIHQRSGQMVTAAGATTQFNSPENGSVILTQNNQINGQLGVLAGQNYGQSFAYAIDRGASLFAINNDVRLNIGARGAEADVISIRARGLATQGNNAVIHARMPYNDMAVGTARSYAGLTLSIPLGGPDGQPGGLATFGESAGSGQAPGAGAIRVEVGDINRPGLGGFLTVLPFEGSNLLPGQVVYLAGPERKGTQAFFYDGARSLDRIPVVYNGSLLLSPQENAALTTAQGAVVLARQEQTRSVVRTENVAGKIINGVVAEVGPGRPATEGEGGAGKPAACDAEDSGLNCAP